MLSLLREWDSNPRPSAYETDELTTATISHLLKVVLRHSTTIDTHQCVCSSNVISTVLTTSETFTQPLIDGQSVRTELVI